MKPGRYGATEAWTIARRAHAADALAVVGLFGESMLGAIPQLAFASALQGRTIAAETSFLGLGEQILGTPLAIRAGMIELPDAPGLAALVDWDRVRHATRRER